VDQVRAVQTVSSTTSRLETESRTIARASIDQTQATQNLARAAGELRTMAKQTRDVTGEQARSLRELVKGNTQLTATAVKVTRATEEQATGAAQKWVLEQGLSAGDELSYVREFEYLTLARLLIAQQQVHEAIALIARLLEAADSDGRTGNTIEILTIKALAHEAQGDVPTALDSLKHALTLAEPEGYVRVFVDEGPPMKRLLSEAAHQEIMPDYVGKLLATFDVDAGEVRSSAQPLIEPLSDRELEVLRLIADGLSNREIGKRLYLALDTVKGHNRRIYAKLGVQRRTEAVACARELGLL
jgi:LuxR family maltose regulon positive regulatory protein